SFSSLCLPLHSPVASELNGGGAETSLSSSLIPLSFSHVWAPISPSFSSLSLGLLPSPCRQQRRSRWPEKVALSPLPPSPMLPPSRELSSSGFWLRPKPLEAARLARASFAPFFFFFLEYSTSI
ncbi:hypothetical protein U1Q18_027831, partial [Sarracenia purpurea var. burkii]